MATRPRRELLIAWRWNGSKLERVNGSGFFVSAASIIWAAAFAWTRWLVRPQPELLIASEDREYRLEQRLAIIDHAVQAIAAEVERLGEGQRLTARLLADRLPQDASARLIPGHRKVDTPH